MSKQQIMSSILIATKGRPKQLVRCLTSILHCSQSNFEILVLDQDRSSATRDAVRGFNRRNIVYIKIGGTGKSRALNIGIEKAKGESIAFTDDDCIVSKKWLTTITKTFNLHRDIDIIFGKTLPYQPSAHRNLTCPSVFSKTLRANISMPCYHATHFGFGNNMAIRRNVFKKLGTFKPWLGPGSIGSNAEDAECALRYLIRHGVIIYNPDMTVWHDRWLNNKALNIQYRSYVCGEMACYGYFCFQGQTFARPIVLANIRDSYYKVRSIMKKIVLLRWNTTLTNDIHIVVVEGMWRARGLFVGLIYSVIDPIRQ